MNDLTQYGWRELFLLLKIRAHSNKAIIGLDKRFT